MNFKTLVYAVVTALIAIEVYESFKLFLWALNKG